MRIMVAINMQKSELINIHEGPRKTLENKYLLITAYLMYAFLLYPNACLPKYKCGCIIIIIISSVLLLCDGRQVHVGYKQRGYDRVTIIIIPLHSQTHAHAHCRSVMAYRPGRFVQVDMSGVKCAYICINV